jgi:hypothetical protein
MERKRVVSSTQSFVLINIGWGNGHLATIDI